MHSRCSICDKEGISMCLIDGHTVDVCKECGAVFIQELNIIVQMPMPLKYNTNWYAVAFGIALAYKHLVSMSEG